MIQEMFLILMLCAPHQKTLDNLMKTNQEAVTFTGLDVQGNVMQLTTAEGGSWTLMRITPEGRACMIQAGTEIEMKSPHSR